MWAVYEKKSVIRQLKSTPRDVLARYEAWKRIVELEGPQGLSFIKGFRDEFLKGKLFGFRSSRLGRKWRVIYKVNKEFLEVFVVEINPHEY
ncbi:MAG: type II toxin-antitoxin system mRNA interferase toxin, RelE/StbE family [Oligoflexia bacterium]|nr:type II toxin-antitoxin system mRNA interferase toxin, RelE/StbE family [Oligoflexia bacterium]